MNRTYTVSVALCSLVLSTGCRRSQSLPDESTTQASTAATCAMDDSGLTVPKGFCVTVFADGLGHARHLAVSPKGVVYVNTWSGEYYGNGPLPEGGFLVALRDTKGLGKADAVHRFGETVQTGGAGGTGLVYFNGYLYAEINDRIVRYALSDDDTVPSAPPQVIVAGLPTDGEHPMHPFVIDSQGMLYVDVASATNSCQKENRTQASPGLDPCKQLETRGGIWRYDANKVGQKFSPAERYVTGIRNAGAIAIDSSNEIYATQHGRDQLAENWPKLYSPEQGATLPAEELLHIEEGAVYGWPQCYYDPAQQKLVLSPEYGGNGGRAIGLCAERKTPIAAFPAHWAPTGLLFYQGTQFPDRYREGAFIAFHGSWNRAPFKQEGYKVVFQPLRGGKPASGCEIFADGFAGEVVSPEGAKHRPTGLAYGGDGALYISDDVKGRIYRVAYQGGGGDPASGTPCPSATAPPTRESEVDQKEVDLPVPSGATKETVMLGSRLYHAQGDVTTTCVGCHGTNGSGTPLGPDLTDDQWVWSDGSVAAIAGTITEGVAQPKNFRNPMPAKGGAELNGEQVTALASYLWALGHVK